MMQNDPYAKNRRLQPHPAIGVHIANQPPDKRPESTWMNPLNKLIWYKAFKQRATEVTLRSGWRFTLDYTSRPGYVFITPVVGFAPGGWFNLKNVTKKEWLDT